MANYNPFLENPSIYEPAYASQSRKWFNMKKPGSAANYSSFVHRLRSIIRIRPPVVGKLGYRNLANVDLSIEDEANVNCRLRIKLRTSDFYILGYQVGRYGDLWELAKNDEARVLEGSKALGFGVQYGQHIEKHEISFGSMKKAVTYLVRERNPKEHRAEVSEMLEILILMIAEASRFEWIRQTFSEWVMRGGRKVPEWVYELVKNWKKNSKRIKGIEEVRLTEEQIGFRNNRDVKKLKCLEHGPPLLVDCIKVRHIEWGDA